MSKGLYVGYWKEGLKSKAQADLLIQRATEHGITELILGVRKANHVGQHVITFPYVEYLKANSGMKISLFVAVLPMWGRFWDDKIQNYHGIDRQWLMTDKPYYTQKEEDSGWLRYVDPMITEGRAWLVDKITSIAESQPDCDIFLNRTNYPIFYNACGVGTAEEKMQALSDMITEISQGIRSVSKGKIILIAPGNIIAKDVAYIDYESLIASGVVDKISPMITSDKTVDSYVERFSQKSFPYIFTYTWDKQINKFDGMDIYIHSYEKMYPTLTKKSEIALKKFQRLNLSGDTN